MQNTELSVSQIRTRRALLDWRDKCIVEAKLRLLQACLDAHQIVTEHVENLDLKTSLFRSSAYQRNTIDPMVSDIVNPVIEGIVKDSERDLLMIADEHFSSPEVSNEEMKAAFADWHAAGTVALGLAPVLGAAGLTTLGSVTAAKTFFVFGGGALLGAFAVPALIGGAVLATAGVYNIGAIKDRRLRKMTQKAHLRIDQLYLDSGIPQTPSALLQIETSVREMSDVLIEKMQHGI